MTMFRMLFEPIRIANLEVRNRLVMAPMTTGYGSLDEFVTPTLIDFMKKL
jgi:2,4-dienoyl-CoA reductase-like NADH-dependent reductase (Old Yellow Enzyme family)